jgi:hypothetical protein
VIVGKSSFYAVLCALALFAANALAVVYIVPPDRELARRAEAIVIAAAGESHAELTARGVVVTVTALSAEDVLKGSVASSFRLVEPGGVLSERSTFIPGSPRFEQGKRYLLFLRHNTDGEWETWGFQLGQFELGMDLRGRQLAARAGEHVFGLNEADGSPYTDHYLDLPTFLHYVQGTSADANYVVDPKEVILGTFPERARPTAFVPAPNFTRPDYLFAGNYRWQNGGTATWGYCCPGNYPTSFGSNPINASGAASSAVTNWNLPTTTVRYSMSGETPGKNTGLCNGVDCPDGANTILFNDPNNQLPGGGVVAIGGISNASGTYSLSDGTFNNTTEADVVVGKNANIPTFVDQRLFVALLTHEIGHTLGFRHSDGTSDPNSPANRDGGCVSPSPCAGPGAAIMAHIVQSPALSLQQWDQDAVNTVYGSGPACTAPSISTPPQSQTITSGQQANLSVIAAGTAPFTYLWYTGTPPGGPVAPGPNNNGATYNPSPTSTTTYWVRVTNSCGTIDSAVATVTVNAATCTPPSITAQPVGSTITAGQFANLSVGASGTTPLTFDWYVGNPPNTASAAGSGQSINVNPTSTTTYWVRVSNSCGTVDSRPATVTVNAATCQPPVVLNDPPDQQITSGNPATLFVGYTGSTATVTWYRGVQNDTSNPVGTGQSITTGPLTSTTQFWAQLVNNCGTAKSRTVTVNVLVACVPPAITQVDVNPKNVAPGGVVTLTAQATGTGLQFQWYRGASPDTSNPVTGANTAVATDTPQGSTSYFVRVSNACGTKDSDPVRVVVSAACTPPSITKITDDTTISSNTTTTLTVAATGDAVLHYQWYRGASGDQSNPVGTDNASFTPPALFDDAQFWVKVSNACAPPANSRAVKITVIPARHRASRK